MTGFEQYKALQKQWSEMCSKEPKAWNEERLQYISLLKEGRIEEFFVSCNNMALFTSLFVLEDGFLMFKKDTAPDYTVMPLFCSHLTILGNYAQVLGAEHLAEVSQ